MIQYDFKQPAPVFSPGRGGLLRGNCGQKGCVPFEDLLHPSGEGFGLRRVEKGRLETPGGRFVGVGQVSQQHRLARGHIFRNREAPGLHAGREHEATGLGVAGVQVRTGQEAIEADGGNAPPLALEPAGVAVFVAGEGQSHAKAVGTEAHFQEPGGLAEVLEVLVAVRGCRVEEHRKAGGVILHIGKPVCREPGRSDDDPFRRKAGDSAQSLSEPILLDDQEGVAMHEQAVGEARELREERDFGVHPPVVQPGFQKGKGSVAVDGLPAGADAGGGVMQGEPEVGLRHIQGKASEGEIFTPEAMEPAFDAPGNFNVADAVEVAEPFGVHDGGDVQVLP